MTDSMHSWCYHRFLAVKVYRHSLAACGTSHAVLLCLPRFPPGPLRPDEGLHAHCGLHGVRHDVQDVHRAGADVGPWVKDGGQGGGYRSGGVGAAGLETTRRIVGMVGSTSTMTV